MGIVRAIIGIVLILAGIFNPFNLSILYRIALIIIGGIIGGLLVFILSIILAAIIFFKILPF
ncbi:MAG: hypothetical protein QXG91_04160 [Candidatus Aenigmatarchaeota archaeon]